MSNFSRTQLDEAAKYGDIVSLQPPYSLFWRYVETDAMPYCAENDMTILAYSPMAQGLLTGKFGAESQFGQGRPSDQEPPVSARNLSKRADRLGQIAIHR